MNLEKHTDDFSRLQELIQSRHIAMLVSKTRNEHLRSRPMLTADVTPYGEILFLTTADSDLIKELTENDYVNLSYGDEHGSSFTSVSGVALMEKDHSAIQEMWHEDFEQWIDGGLDNPDITLLKINPAHAEHWARQHSKDPLRKLLSLSAKDEQPAVHETIGSL